MAISLMIILLLIFVINLSCVQKVTARSRKGIKFAYHVVEQEAKD